MEYQIQNMTHLVIQIYNSMLELILLLLYNFLLLYELFMFFYVLEILRFDKAIFFSPLLQSNLLVSLIIKTRNSEVLLVSEFMNIVSIFIILLI